MNALKRIYSYGMAHKVVTGLVIVVIAAGGYFGYKHYSNDSGETRYVLVAVEKGTLTSSISGTGQVAASNEIDLKSKASGDITFIGVKAGDTVKKGAIIARLDAGDASKAVRDAEIALENAEISLQKTVKPADSTAMLQAQNNLTEAEESKTSSENNLEKARDDGFNAVANAFLDMPNILDGIDSMLNNGSGPLSANGVKIYGDKASSYRDIAAQSYYDAKNKMDLVESDYKSMTRASNSDDIDSLINNTYDAAELTADAVKNTKNLLDYVEGQSTSGGQSTDLNSDESSLTNFTSQANSIVSDLLSSTNSIESGKTTLEKADRTIEESQSSLADLQEGADALDVRTAELSVTQKQNALNDANEKLADYTVTAPFDGVIGSIASKVGDSSSGDAIATLLTDQKIATISLNEVDVAKVKVGQKVNLTFDALPDLSMSGEVAEVSALGTVSQGVVSYDVKIGFDTQDDRIKSGMSVSASIITDSVTDALMVPSSAIKSDSQGSYVQVLDGITASQISSAGVTSSTAPRSVGVEVGLSNDTETQIISGLDEGQYVVTRTTTGTQTTTATTQTTNRGLFGGGTTGRTTGGGLPR